MGRGTRSTTISRVGAIGALPLLACVLVAGMGAAPARTDAALNLNFTLKNRLGVTIYSVYVSPHQVDDWEEDVLGDKTLADGRQIEITFTEEIEERGDIWDLKVVTSDGDSYTWTEPGFNLTQVSEITIYLKGGEATATWR